MTQKLKNKVQGFTIIEVLIVLAIAALILLIVFLAVPALQRNSRNTQIRNDAATLLGYVNDFAANNNGAIPTDICYDANTGNVGMTISGTCSPSTNNVGKIRGGLASVDNGTTAASATQTIILVLNKKCSQVGTTGTTNRAVAATFQVETAGAPVNQCTET